MFRRYKKEEVKARISRRKSKVEGYEVTKSF
jgi:hypothetical protein